MPDSTAAKAAIAWNFPHPILIYVPHSHNDICPFTLTWPLRPNLKLCQEHMRSSVSTETYLCKGLAFVLQNSYAQAANQL